MLPETEVLVSYTPAQRRNLEQADALDFMVYGHEEHAERCFFASQGEAPCSRDYDPLPYRGTRGRDKNDVIRTTTARQLALPVESYYAGTGIGALYGLPGSEGFLWEVAGWNVGAGQKLENAHHDYEVPASHLFDAIAEEELNGN